MMLKVCLDGQRQTTSIPAACHNTDESHWKQDVFKSYLGRWSLIYAKQLSGKMPSLTAVKVSICLSIGPLTAGLCVVPEM